MNIEEKIDFFIENMRLPEEQKRAPEMRERLRRALDHFWGAPDDVVVSANFSPGFTDDLGTCKNQLIKVAIRAPCEPRA